MTHYKNNLTISKFIFRSFTRLVLFLSLSTTVINAYDLPLYLMYEKVLKNGLKVVIIPIEDSQIVSLYTLVRVGSRNEVEEGKTGFVHLFEHILLRASEQNSDSTQINLMRKIGATYKAFSSVDYTCFSLSAPVKYMNDILYLEAKRIIEPVYSKTDLEIESGAMIGEYHIQSASPLFKMEEKLRELIFDAHPYKHSEFGNYRDMLSLGSKYKESKKFYQRYYHPENSVLIIVGGFSKTGDIFKIVEENYARWERGYKPKIIPQDSKRIRHKSFELTSFPDSKAKMMIAWKIPAYNANSDAPQLIDILAEHYFSPYSTLYELLVKSEKVVSDIEFDYEKTRDDGFLKLTFHVNSQKDYEYISDTVFEILDSDRYALDPVALDKIKSRIIYRDLMTTSTTQEIAEALIPYISLTGNAKEQSRYLKSMKKVAIYDFDNLKDDIFNRRNSSIITLKVKEDREPAR